MRRLVCLEQRFDCRWSRPMKVIELAEVEMIVLQWYLNV